MSQRLNGSGLFIQAIQGLTSNYAQLMVGNSEKGLTLDSITNPGDDVNKNLLNSSFTSYLTTNFSSIDKDNDGIITSDELQNYTNSMANGGMTLEQLYQLCSQYGYANSQLEEVIANFNKIDKNHDGKVTNAEISAFGIDQEYDEIKDKYKRVSEASTASIFYSTGNVEDVDEDEDK